MRLFHVYSAVWALEKPKLKQKVRWGLSLLFLALFPLFLWLTLSGTNQSQDRGEAFFYLLFYFYLCVLVPIFCFFWGSGLVTEDWEEGRAVYLWTTSTPRYHIWLARWGLYMVYLWLLAMVGGVLGGAVWWVYERGSDFSLPWLGYLQSLGWASLCVIWVYLNLALLFSLFFRQSFRISMVYLFLLDFGFAIQQGMTSAKLAPSTYTLHQIYQSFQPLVGKYPEWAKQFSPGEELSSGGVVLFLGLVCLLVSLIRFSSMEALSVQSGES